MPHSMRGIQSLTHVSCLGADAAGRRIVLEVRNDKTRTVEAVNRSLHLHRLTEQTRVGFKTDKTRKAYGYCTKLGSSVFELSK